MTDRGAPHRSTPDQLGPDRRGPDRRGFTLITVLWTMTVASGLALVAASNGRATLDAARNRIAAERAYWTAVGCASTIQAHIDSLLRAAPTLPALADVWRSLGDTTDSIVHTDAGDCEARFSAAGTTLDLNAASTEMLASLWRAVGMDETTVASWSDSVNARRARAEQFSDIRELANERERPALDTLLSTDAGRVSLATAPATVLATLPGFTRETADLVVTLRSADAPVRDLLELAPRLSAESRSLLLAHLPDLAQLTVTEPDAWLLTIRSVSGRPQTTVVLRQRLEHAGHSSRSVRAWTTW